VGRQNAWLGDGRMHGKAAEVDCAKIPGARLDYVRHRGVQLGRGTAQGMRSDRLARCPGRPPTASSLGQKSDMEERRSAAGLASQCPRTYACMPV
jgi:hypothetical protein